MSGIETTKNTDTFSYPFLGLEFSTEGFIDADILKNQIIPTVVEALIEAGESEKKARHIVRMSLGAVMDATVNYEADETQEEIRRILHNIDASIRSSKVSDDIQEIDHTPVEFMQLGIVHDKVFSREEISNIVIPKVENILRLRGSQNEKIVNIKKALVSLAKSNGTLMEINETLTTMLSHIENALIDQIEQQNGAITNIEPVESGTKMFSVTAAAPGDDSTISTVDSIKPEFISQLPKDAWQEEYLEWQDEGKSAVHAEEETEVQKQERFLQERINRTSEQLNAIRDRSRELREETGLSDREARDTRTDFYELRTYVRKLRAEIRRLASNELTDESREKVQHLRNEIARSYVAFRKNVAEETKSSSHVEGLAGAYVEPSVVMPANQDSLGIEPNEPVEAVIDVENEEVLKELRQTFETTVQQHSIHAGGVLWYQEHISKDIPFSQLFSYLQQNLSETDAKFRDKIYAVVKTQISFQAVAAAISFMLKDEHVDKKELEEKVQSLQTIGRQVVLMQRRYNTASLSEQEEARDACTEMGEIARDFVPPVEPETEPSKSKFASREHIRDEYKIYREKKTQFEKEYEAFLKSEKERKENQSYVGKLKGLLWRKEKPESLIKAENDYLSARTQYAEVLDGRFERSTVAKHLVERVVDSRREIDREFLTQKQSAVLQSLQQVFSEHKSTIRKFGLVAVFATGSVFGVARAGAGYLKDYIASDPALASSVSAQYIQSAASSLASMSGAAFGAVSGTYAGNALGSWNVNRADKRRSRAKVNAAKNFRSSAIEALESELYNSENKYDTAVKNKGKIVAAGAVAGGILGGTLAGDLDGVPDVIEKSSYGGLGSVNEYIGQKDFHGFNTITPEVNPNVGYNTSGAFTEYVAPGDPNNLVSQQGEQVSEPKSRDQIIADAERVLGTETPQQSDFESVPTTMNYTFVPGDRINTVSEALNSILERNPSLIEGDMTPGEAVREFNHQIEHLKNNNPDHYYDILDQMGVTSGNIDEVGAGKTYNFSPLVEYVNSLPE